MIIHRDWSPKIIKEMFIILVLCKEFQKMIKMPSLCFGRIPNDTPTPPPPARLELAWNDIMHGSQSLSLSLSQSNLSAYTGRATSTLPLDYKRFFVLHIMAGKGVFADLVDEESATFSYYADGQWKKSSSAHSVPVLNPTSMKPHFKITGMNHLSSSSPQQNQMYIWTLIGHRFSTANMKPLSNMYIKFHSLCCYVCICLSHRIFRKTNVYMDTHLT